MAAVAPVPACGRLHPGVGPARLGMVRAGSPVALATSRAPQGASPAARGERTIAYVADADEPTLHTIDVDTQREIATTRLRGRPEQLLVLADGRVAVTLRSSNAIEVLEPAAQPESGLTSR